MLEAIDGLITFVSASAWGYLVIFFVVAADAFFPVMPGEVVMISGSVLAASGELNILGVTAVAAVGAFAGDHISYAIGRVAGRRIVATIVRGPRGRGGLARAEGILHRRGGVVIIALRFVSGGRTATTMIAGTLHYPPARFAGYDAVAAMLWALYMGQLGYWVGRAFEGRPLLALLTGLGIAAVLTVASETVRLCRRRSHTRL